MQPREQDNEQDFEQEELQSRAHADLSKRARGGIFIYLLGWLVMTVPSSIYLAHPQFFYLNSSILVGIMVLRATHLVVDFYELPLSLRIRRTWLVWGILAGALHWGLLSAWVVMHPEHADIKFQIISAAAVLGIAGTAALSIAREIRLLYSPFIMFPLLIALVARGGADNLTLAVMAALAVVYITVTAKTVSQDYWKAIGSEQLAEQRALQMEKLSHTDQLTQLSNRSFFDRRFREEWKRGIRVKSQLSVLMLDLDNFKALNDKHGHLFGDRCLQHVAQAMRDAETRETDLLARYGGEEFVALLPDTDAESAAKVAERLRVAVENCLVKAEDESVALSCSIGGATMQPVRGLDPEYLLEQSDSCLYQAKDAGRNCYVATAEPFARLWAGS